MFQHKITDDVDDGDDGDYVDAEEDDEEEYEIEETDEILKNQINETFVNPFQLKCALCDEYEATTKHTNMKPLQCCSLVTVMCI